MQKKEHKCLICFEGVVDEIALVFFIRKISESKVLSVKLKSTLKFVLIELVTNMISHNSGDSYGLISIEREKDGYSITTRNYSTRQNYKIIQSNIDAIKRIKNTKSYYNEQLKTVSFDKSVNLGLIEIYTRCGGMMKVTSKTEDKQLLITFKIKINDIN